MKNDDLGEIYEDIPHYDNGVWTYKSYESREAFAKDLENNYFKEPGEYAFDETVKMFQAPALYFKKEGYYCDALDGTRDFIKYWDAEKLKSRKGAFFTNNEKSWYLPRDYYFFINFVKIQDKKKKKDDFTDIWDGQLHLALYNWLAELNYKHAVTLKKRQFGSSLYHAAKLINILWFEQSPVLKIGASLSAYVTGETGTWKILQEYRNFLNEHTAWYRPMNPGNVGGWQQKIEYVENGRKTEKGRKGVLKATSFEQSDTAGVGGLCTLFFYEEAGVAKSMDKTYEFMRPAFESGDLTTGLFCAAGSVGDLDQCEPLKKFMYAPEANDFYSVRNKYMDDKGTVAYTGMFIPEQWSMPPYIDEFGNSLVEEALEACERNRIKWKKDLDPEIYQLRVSQHPTTLEEAFAYRGESIFPLQVVKTNKRDIEEGMYPFQTYKLAFSNTGEVVAELTKKAPITEFPIPKNAEDKTGAIQVWELPDEDREFCTTYYASVDPVGEGKTVTSESLCSIYVYKNPVLVQRSVHGEIETFVEGGKIVAAWCGRYDDINKTHEQLELIIQWYDAWTLVENNVGLFIQYMQFKRKQKYLVPSTQMVLSKEIQQSKTQFQTYGWRNVSTIFKSTMLSYLIEYIKEELDVEKDDNGKVFKTLYGISRIPDKMAMIEMESYQPGVNVDRLVSLGALITFVKIQESGRGIKKRIEYEDDSHLDNSEKFSKLNRSPFKNLGRSSYAENTSVRVRNPFKNIR